MKILELTTYERKMFNDLEHLIGGLTENVVLTEEMVRRTIDDNNSHLYVMVEGERIVGSASLCVYETLTGRKASVENVVVASEYRGKHLGRKLVEHILEEAQQLAPIEINLTSKPIRVAANALYQSLGFVQRTTNCYQMKFEHLRAARGCSKNE